MIPWLSTEPDSTDFPPTDTAMPEPNGLLAAGGRLSPARLLAARCRQYEQQPPPSDWDGVFVMKTK